MQVFNRFKLKISFTFFLLTIENILNLLIPFFLGIAINDLIDGTYDGVLYFSAIFFGIIIIGVSRRAYDTRVYSGIYTKIASETVELQIEKKSSDSKVVARANLIEEVSDFFEYELSQGFTSLFGVIGSIIMLFLFDYKIFIAGLIAIFLILLVYLFSEKKIFRFNKAMNDQLDKHVDIISEKNGTSIFKHFKKLAFWKIKLSDLESINFGIIEIILFGLIIFTLIIASTQVDATAGSIFAILAYVIDFSEGVGMLPYIYQQKVRLNEIVTRINAA